MTYGDLIGMVCEPTVTMAQLYRAFADLEENPPTAEARPPYKGPCLGRKRNGEPCTRKATDGLRVCAQHASKEHEWD